MSGRREDIRARLAEAVVELPKITGYLLSPVHDAGREKARFFGCLGYSVDFPAQLADDLRELARLSEDIQVVESAYGTKIIAQGILRGPHGLSGLIRTVWISEAESLPFRLVTAYPARGPK